MPPAYTDSTEQRREWIAALHLGLMVLVATWCFGGNIGWAQDILTGLGLCGLPLTAMEALSRRRLGAASYRSFWWLLPLMLFNTLVLLSLTRPSYRHGIIEGAQVFLPLNPPVQGLSTARPDFSLRALLLFNALYLPAFNLAILARSRTTLRRLLYFLAGNAVVLAVFGTLQKLTHAKGLFFGEVRSPNATFFATFIYHNHWGAFVVLAAAVSLGLIFHIAESRRHRDFFHSPAFGGLLALVGLAASVPLSTSRSCTLLVVTLLGVAGVHALIRLHRSDRYTSGRKRALTAAMLVTTGLVSVGIFQFARPVFAARLTQTREQLAEMRSTGGIGARAALYRDTWRMAQERPLFGWGLGSYGTVFPRFNTQQGAEGLPHHYVDAHSDWLQSAAETGLVGTALRGLMILLPLLALRGTGRLSCLSLYPLLGCLWLLVYAWVEFPFGNTAVVLCFWTCFFAAIRLQQLDARERSA